ncbi:hypothetical protein BH11ACT2_BH11ACT2_11550 [soil metagenome]
MADNGYFPPVQYSPIWLIIGVGLIVLVVAWIIVLLVITRRRPQAEAANPLAGLPADPVALRASYVSLIDEVAVAHARGALDFRQAHQRLSLIVRQFAGEARGIRAPYMTLEDLRALRLTPLSSTIGQLYPGAFSGQETGSVDTAVARARHLVSEWR